MLNCQSTVCVAPKGHPSGFSKIESPSHVSGLSNLVITGVVEVTSKAGNIVNYRPVWETETEN